MKYSFLKDLLFLYLSYTQTPQFVKEKIEVLINNGYYQINGDYYFHNSLPAWIKRNLFYPFALSSNLAFPDFVEINVYDLVGKLVEKLFAGQQNRGEYKVHWNAESVAFGIYIYQIKTKKFINHKKCLLIK